MPSPLNRKTLNGVWAALITPWDAQDRLDERRMAAEVRSYGGTGVAGVYTGGTTGEFYTQDDATFQRITEIVCAEAKGVGLPVQIGCTALSTRTARQRIGHAVRRGADGIQIALPFWLELKDDEAVGFLQDAAAAAGDLPLILYHTMRAKRKLEPKLLGEVARKIPSLIGLKDGCDIPTLKEILANVPDIAVFGGEHDLLEKIPAGARGTYSSVSGLCPRRVVELYNLCAAGKLAEARPLHEAISQLMSEVLIPMVQDEGLFDSAVDRVQRVAGGGDVGLACQKPYRSATPAHVERLKSWCRENAPILLS